VRSQDDNNESPSGRHAELLARHCCTKRQKTRWVWILKFRTEVVFDMAGNRLVIHCVSTPSPRDLSNISHHSQKVSTFVVLLVVTDVDLADE
jgi:hypothetical protein